MVIRINQHGWQMKSTWCGCALKLKCCDLHLRAQCSKAVQTGFQAVYLIPTWGDFNFIKWPSSAELEVLNIGVSKATF